MRNNYLNLTSVSKFSKTIYKSPRSDSTKPFQFFVRVKSTSSFFRGLVIQKSAVKATLRQQEIEID